MKSKLTSPQSLQGCEAMIDQTLSERLRKYPTWATTELRNQMLEAADALDAKDAEIERLEGSKCDCPAIEQADKIDQQSALLAGAKKALEVISVCGSIVRAQLTARSVLAKIKAAKL